MSIRKILFWTHLAVGLVAGLFVAFMAATGSLLAVQPLVTRIAERQLVAASTVSNTTCVAPSQIMLNAQQQTGRGIGSLQLFADRRLPVQIEFGGESVLLADPCSGRILSSGASRLRSFFLVVRNLHESAALSHTRGGVLRNIKNAANLGFFFLLLSGLFLWWPRKWKKTNLRAAMMLRTSLRGRARDWNLHNVAGFWLVLPLLVISLTGAVMSYSWANRVLYRISGTPAPPSHDEAHNQDARQQEPTLATSASAQRFPVEEVIISGRNPIATSSSAITARGNAGLTAKADTRLLEGGARADSNHPDHISQAALEDASPKLASGRIDLTQEKSGATPSVIKAPDEAPEIEHVAGARHGDHSGFEHLHSPGELPHHDDFGGQAGAVFSHHEPNSADQGQRLSSGVSTSPDLEPSRSQSYRPQRPTERALARGDGHDTPLENNPILHQQSPDVVPRTPHTDTTNGINVVRSDGLTGARPEHSAGRRRGGRRGSPSRVLSAADLLALDPLVEMAKAQFPNWRSLRMRLTGDGDQTINFTFDDSEDGGGGVQRSDLVLNRTTGAVIEWVPFYQTSRGQRWRIYVRSLHTGELFGYFGQTIAFLAAIAALILVWTGIALTARRFSAWRIRRGRAISNAIKPLLGASATSSSAQV